jgi:hypothetical protein
VTNAELWGALFLAGGIFSAWKIFTSVDCGRWNFWLGHRSSPGGRLPILTVDRRSHPLVFWAAVTWDLLVMIALVAVGTYALIVPLVARFSAGS